MSRSVLQLPDGQCLAIDEKGYLLNHNDWSPVVAETMAAAARAYAAEQSVVLERVVAELEPFLLRLRATPRSVR